MRQTFHFVVKFWFADDSQIFQEVKAVNIFLSWSGERSKALAEVLESWLPTVLGSVNPWMSGHDIAKGVRWSDEIAQQLDQTTVGIICLTKENLHSPWLLFEAGALSKSAATSLVCPYLIDDETPDPDGPLGQFQATRHNREEVWNLVRSINGKSGESAFDESELNLNFNKLWPLLDRNIAGIGHSRRVPGGRKPLVAALAGAFAVVVLGVQTYLYFAPVHGTLEWQWAGSGWIGDVTIRDGKAHVRMDLFEGGGSWNKKLLFESDPDGVAQRRIGFLHTSGLRLRMPVQTTGADGRPPERVILEADLDAVPAFRGPVVYRVGEKIPTAEMTLVGKPR
ncbi:MAG: TIR domain-containing protein [Bryobacteraceae bacterium]